MKYLTKTSLLILLVACLVNVLTAQNSRFDSLATAIATLADDTAKVHRLYDLAKTIEKENNLRGRDGLQQALTLAARLKDHKWQAAIEYALARNYIHANSFDTALVHTEASRFHAEKAQDLKSEAKAYYLFQYVYKRQGAYEKANEYAFRSLKIYEKMGDRKGIAGALSKIGSLYFALEKWQDAIDYAQQSLEIAKKEQLPDDIAYAARLMADTYAKLNENEKAIPYLNEALSIYREMGDQLQVAMALDSRGMLLSNLSKNEEALADYLESLRMCQQLGADIMLNSTYHNIGNIYYRMGNYAEALKYLQKSIAETKKAGVAMAEDKTYHQLALTFAGLGRYDSAFYYQTLSKQMRDSLMVIENTKQIAELKTQYETEKKEATITQQKEALHQERTRFWLSTALFGLALAGGLLLLRLTHTLRKRNDEKEFLIKEIHHRVKNNLQVLSSLLHLQSRHIQDDAALDAVREGQNRVEAMGLIHQKLYMGDNLASVEMRDYLHNLGDTLLDSFGINGQVKIIYQVQPMHLDVDTAIPLGLIINELVTNSLKYAFPEGRQGIVEIALWKNETGQLCLKVSDDGVGKSGTPKLNSSTSFGTNLVEMLSKKLKGTIQVTDSNGYATVIIFENFKEAK